jgi:glycosyltransferase involved in cell wall biosynthesis
MGSQCRVLAVAQGRIPTVELAAIYPFTWLNEAGACEFRYRDAADVTAEDLLWSDVLFLIRSGSERMNVLFNEARRLKRFIIAYWDDNPFDVPKSSASHGSFAAMLPRITAVMKGADAAVCSTRACAEVFQHATGREVGVLRSCPVINPVSDWKSRDRDQSGSVFGYAGSTDHWVVVQEMIFPALEELLLRKVVFTCEIMGPDVKVPDHLKACVVLREPIYQYEEWLKVRNSLKWNFALAPLKQSAFNRCKTPNKFLEYSAAAIPCIFSEIEPYTELVVAGENGLFAGNSETSWADAISLMIRDGELRNSIAEKALRIAQAEYGCARIVPEYKRLLESMGAAEPRIPRNVLCYRAGFKMRLYWHLFSWRTLRLKLMNRWSRLFRQT